MCAVKQESLDGVTVCVCVCVCVCCWRLHVRAGEQFKPRVHDLTSVSSILENQGLKYDAAVLISIFLLQLFRVCAFLLLLLLLLFCKQHFGCFNLVA